MATTRKDHYISVTSTDTTSLTGDFVISAIWIIVVTAPTITIASEGQTLFTQTLSSGQFSGVAFSDPKNVDGLSITISGGSATVIIWVD